MISCNLKYKNKQNVIIILIQFRFFINRQFIFKNSNFYPFTISKLQFLRFIKGTDRLCKVCKIEQNNQLGYLFRIGVMSVKGIDHVVTYSTSDK